MFYLYFLVIQFLFICIFYFSVPFKKCQNKHSALYNSGSAGLDTEDTEDKKMVNDECLKMIYATFLVLYVLISVYYFVYK